MRHGKTDKERERETDRVRQIKREKERDRRNMVRHKKRERDERVKEMRG